MRSPVTSESEWADICQKGAICVCLSVIRRGTMETVTRCQARAPGHRVKDVIQLRGTDAWLARAGEEERAICWYFMIIIFNWAGPDRTHARLSRHTSHFWESSGPGAGADCIVSSHHQMAAWLLVAIKTKSAPVTRARREYNCDAGQDRVLYGSRKGGTDIGLKFKLHTVHKELILTVLTASHNPLWGEGWGPGVTALSNIRGKSRNNSSGGKMILDDFHWELWSCRPFSQPYLDSVK